MLRAKCVELPSCGTYLIKKHGYVLLTVIAQLYITLLLNIGYVSNETNEDVRMYIEEFILVEIWIHCCTKLK